MKKRSSSFLLVALLITAGYMPFSTVYASANSPWADVKIMIGGNTEGKGLPTFFSAEDLQNIAALDKIPPYKSLPGNLNERIIVWRKIAKTLLAEAPDTMAAAGSCEAYSVLWLQRLTLEGYPLFYAQTSGVGDVMVNGQAKKLDKIHVFVVDRGLCSGEGDDPLEIIVCPTWTQFFEPGECLFPDSLKIYLDDGGKWNPEDELKTLPPVFVGTRHDLVSVYLKFKDRLRSAQQSGVDADSGKYEPASLASLHYSFGANKALRTNILLNNQ